MTTDPEALAKQMMEAAGKARAGGPWTEDDEAFVKLCSPAYITAVCQAFLAMKERAEKAELEADHQRRCAQEWFERGRASEQALKGAEEALERIEEHADLMMTGRSSRVNAILAAARQALATLHTAGSPPALGDLNDRGKFAPAAPESA